MLFAVAACVAFFHPFCYYPDVDTHGRFLQALRDNPSLLVDPTQPWQRRGDVTREIGGQKVPIPYAMVFHASAWPLSPLLGDTGALKTVAVISAAAVVLLVHAAGPGGGAGSDVGDAGAAPGRRPPRADLAPVARPLSDALRPGLDHAAARAPGPPPHAISTGRATAPPP